LARLRLLAVGGSLVSLWRASPGVSGPLFTQI